MAPRADRWERRNREAFLSGYLRRPGIRDLLPRGQSSLTTVLAAFELDKAVYELGYERAGAVSDKEAKEMIHLARQITAAVKKWLAKSHAKLMKS